MSMATGLAAGPQYGTRPLSFTTTAPKVFQELKMYWSNVIGQEVICANDLMRPFCSTFKYAMGINTKYTAPVAFCILLISFGLNIR